MERGYALRLLGPAAFAVFTWPCQLLADGPQQPKYGDPAELQKLPISELERLSGLGDVNAMTVLGYEYFLGERVAMDRQKALASYEHAALLGSDNAMANICNMYWYGLGVEKDAITAYRWCQSGAKLGNSNAMVMLAEIVYDGNGLLRDKSEEFRNKATFQLYEMAAKRGHMVGQFNAARMLESGVGTTPNRAATIDYYELSAKQGYAPASEALSRLGVTRNPK